MSSSLSSLLTDISLATILSDTSSLHPFSEPTPDISALIQLLERTSQLSASLRQSASLPQPSSSSEIPGTSIFGYDPDSRTVALLKEHTTHGKAVEDGLNDVSNFGRAFHASRKNLEGLYGEDIPLGRAEAAEYILAQIEKNTTAAGLMVFKDVKGEEVDFACGGKLLVLDIKFNTSPSLASTSTTQPFPLTLVSLNVTPGDNTSTIPAAVLSADEYLPALLSRLIRKIMKECTVPVPDGQAVFLLWKKYRKILEHLVYLDELAAEENSKFGHQWLRQIGTLADIAERLTAEEGRVLSSEGKASALDVLVKRGHSVPLPHLIGPSLSFLTSISPKAYLSLTRSQSNLSSSLMDVNSSPSTAFDVRSSKLRDFVCAALDASSIPNSTNETLFTLATLKFERSESPHQVWIDKDSASPSFPLVPAPQQDENAMDEDNTSHIPSQILSYELLQHEGTEYSLNLQSCSLSQRDKPGGIWLTQSAAMAIYDITGVSIIGDQGVPMIVDEVHDPLGLGVNIEMSSTAGTVRYCWFDRLINPTHPAAAGSYKSTIPSPSRPVVRLTFVPNAEPGFYVSRVPVRSLKQVYAVLEVLRDHAPMSQFLRTAKWEPQYDQRNRNESYVSISGNGDEQEEIDLDSLLSGSYTPASIPCTVETALSPAGSYNGSLKLTFPLPQAGSPLVSVVVSHDSTAPVGVRVLISTTTEADLNEEFVEKLQRGAEEFIRRGGGLRVVRWIWDHSRSPTAT